MPGFLNRGGVSAKGLKNKGDKSAAPLVERRR